jgi:1-aminocyclopropane-1-carboxylate deaminase/D-cysteine desulfhydrase-like pyridoxal-dependent ACC family enzyme
MPQARQRSLQEIAYRSAITERCDLHALNASRTTSTTADLAAEIKALNPQLSVISIAFEGAGPSGKATTQTPGESAAALIKEMAGQFPDIVTLVRAYGALYPAATMLAAF